MNEKKKKRRSIFGGWGLVHLWWVGALKYKRGTTYCK
jgi:hypothetical protein